MKKKIILFFLILLLFVIDVSAHPGRTDSDGGHYDHSTGEYHYHHGYEAHYHINGQCPYEERIDYENNYSSNDNNSSVNYAKIEKKKDSVFSSIVDFIISSELLSCIVLAVLFYGIMFVIIRIKEWIDNLRYKRKTKKQREENGVEKN